MRLGQPDYPLTTETAVISRGMPGRTRKREVPRNRLFAGVFCGNRRCTLCLPCRRSRVRIPSAASEKACICRPFLCAQSAGAFASRRTETGPTANQPYFRLEEGACLQGILDRSNARPLARDAEGHEFDARRPDRLGRHLSQRGRHQAGGRRAAAGPAPMTMTSNSGVADGPWARGLRDDVGDDVGIADHDRV